MAGATMVPEPVFDVGRGDGADRRASASRVLPGPPTSSSRCSTTRTRRARPVARCGWWSPAPRWCRSSWSQAMWSELGFETVLTAYGLTEACGTVTMCRRGDSAEVIAGTSGRAIPGLEVRIVDAGGAEVADGRARRDRGAGLHRDARLLATTRRRARGDRRRGLAAHRRHRGHGRGRQRHHHRPAEGHVREGGFNAYPAEIEAILRGHPAVGQVAVVGVPDERMGEVGCACVVAGGGRRAPTRRARTSSIRSWSRERHGQLQGAPASVPWVDALPVNASGKVLKRELRPHVPPRRRMSARPPAGRRWSLRTTIVGIDERGRDAMRGIVYTGDEASRSPTSSRCGDPGPTRCRCASGAPGCATPTCR